MRFSQGYLQNTDGYASFVRAIEEWKQMPFLPYAVLAENTSVPFDNGSVELTERGVS
jgi:hypothetical protein